METILFTNRNEKAAYVQALLYSLKAAGVKFLRFQATDAGNTLRVKAVPLARLREDPQTLLEDQVVMAQVVFGGLPTFADGIQSDSGLDASKLVRLVPDITTLSMLPYAPQSATVTCNLHKLAEPDTASPLCCRSLLHRVLQKIKIDHNLAFVVGTELEFCLFKDGQPVDASRFCMSATLNQQHDFLQALYDSLEDQSVVVHQLHAESAPGQMEVILRHTNAVTLADRLGTAKETIRAVAQKHGMQAIFLPKIQSDQAGNGNHFHISFADATTGTNLFASRKRNTTTQTGSVDILLHPSVNDLSDTAQAFLEGILTHLPALLAVTMPSTNSFRRVGPGCWTGSSVTWDWDNKEAPLRIVADIHSRRRASWNRLEYKLMDATANPYLALASILTAGCDGIQRQARLRDVGTTRDQVLPTTLPVALDALEGNAVLTEALSPALVRAYLATRRAEVAHSGDWTLDQEVAEALRRA